MCWGAPYRGLTAPTAPGTGAPRPLGCSFVTHLGQRASRGGAEAVTVSPAWEGSRAPRCISAETLCSCPLWASLAHRAKAAFYETCLDLMAVPSTDFTKLSDFFGETSAFCEEDIVLLARSPIHADASGSPWRSRGEPGEPGGAGGSQAVGRTGGLLRGEQGAPQRLGGLRPGGSHNGKGQKALSEVVYLQERVEF